MPQTGVKLDAKKLDELKEAFTIFAQDNKDKVNRSQATDIIRSLGFTPTDDELVKMLGERDRVFTKDELHHIITTKAPQPENEQTLKEAFGIFDRDGNGYIHVNEIRHVLVHLGEKLSDDEVDEMIRESNISGDNQINYEELVNKIVSLNNF